ncbi:MAG: NAD(P)-dependent oxidoreductase [Clostridia bacterium]|nr:NAD(P)-dependent oxidoreductase [Clostridia bacterium]
MKKILLTGANGFIGSALIKELSAQGVQVYAVIKDREERVEHIQKYDNVFIVYCDLAEIERIPSLIEDRDIDTCIHLAWAGSFGDGRADYALQLQNVQYSMDLINVAANMGIKRFVGAGTLAEKDVQNYHPTDGATPNAVSIYGIAKITAHYMTKAECTRLGMEHIWCYLSNTYGVGNTTNNFVNMASRLMLQGKRAAFTAGEQSYDFVYIDDTARAIFYAAEKGHANTAYYLGSTKQRKLKEYITIIRDTIDSNIPLYLGEIPFNGNPLPEEAYDTQKLVEHTGYYPSVLFEDGIKRTIDWLKTV